MLPDNWSSARFDTTSTRHAQLVHLCACSIFLSSSSSVLGKPQPWRKVYPSLPKFEGQGLRFFFSESRPFVLFLMHWWNLAPCRRIPPKTSKGNRSGGYDFWKAVARFARGSYTPPEEMEALSWLLLFYFSKTKNRNAFFNLSFFPLISTSFRSLNPSRKSIIIKVSPSLV